MCMCAEKNSVVKQTQVIDIPVNTFNRLAAETPELRKYRKKYFTLLSKHPHKN